MKLQTHFKLYYLINMLIISFENYIVWFERVFSFGLFWYTLSVTILFSIFSKIIVHIYIPQIRNLLKGKTFIKPFNFYRWTIIKFLFSISKVKIKICVKMKIGLRNPNTCSSYIVVSYYLKSNFESLHFNQVITSNIFLNLGFRKQSISCLNWTLHVPQEIIIN